VLTCDNECLVFAIAKSRTCNRKVLYLQSQSLVIGDSYLVNGDLYVWCENLTQITH